MRTVLMIALLFGAGFLFSVMSAPVQAADKKEVKTEAKAEKKVDHPEEKKEDPLAFTGIRRYDLGIYTLIVFVLLYLVLKTFAWGPISQGLEKREQVLLDARADALKERDEAKKFHEEAKAILAKASDSARGIVEEARRDGQVVKEKLLAEGEAEVQAERERLRKEIALARDQALQEIWNQTVQLSTLVSSKTIRRTLSSEDHSRLLAESMDELKQNLGRA